LLLKRWCPDRSIVTLNAAPTGLVLILNLDPDNRSPGETCNAHVSAMLGWSLKDVGLSAYPNEMGIKSTRDFDRHKDITTWFWPYNRSCMKERIPASGSLSIWFVAYVDTRSARARQDDQLA
jgi:hypothetical protein